MGLYTLIYQNGMPLDNNITDDLNYPIEEGQRLLADVPPTDYDHATKALRRVEPVPVDAAAIEYIIIDKPADHSII